MTEEQTKACEALAKKFVGTDAAYEGAEQRVWECGVEYGFQATQTPEMLMLNPLVKGLVEALERSVHHRYHRLNEASPIQEKALAPFKEVNR